MTTIKEFKIGLKYYKMYELYWMIIIVFVPNCINYEYNDLIV